MRSFQTKVTDRLEEMVRNTDRRLELVQSASFTNKGTLRVQHTDYFKTYVIVAYEFQVGSPSKIIFNAAPASDKENFFSFEPEENFLLEKMFARFSALLSEIKLAR